jgi:hypothetical protein
MISKCFSCCSVDPEGFDFDVNLIQNFCPLQLQFPVLSFTSKIFTALLLQW